MSWLQELQDKLESIEGLPEPIGISINIHSEPREIQIQLHGGLEEFLFIAKPEFAGLAVRLDSTHLRIDSRVNEGVSLVAVTPRDTKLSSVIVSTLEDTGIEVRDEG